MHIVIQLDRVADLARSLDSTIDGPTIDLEAILDYICGEYMLGTRCLEKVLSDCIDGLGPVRDCDYCEVTYNKVVNELHQLIVLLYQSLDEHRLRDFNPYKYSDLRTVLRWRDLYVFKLE